MELFLALYAVIDHLMEAQNREISSAAVQNRETSSAVSVQHSNISSYNTRRVSSSKIVFYILLWGSLLFSFIFFITHPLLYPWYDDKSSKPKAVFLNALIRLVLNSWNCVLFSVILTFWKVVPTTNTNSHQPLRMCFSKWICCLRYNWKNSAKQADLRLLLIAFIFSSATVFPKIIIHAHVYYFAEQDWFTKFGMIFGDLCKLVAIASFFIEFKVIQRFLTFNDISYTALRQQTFILQMPLVALSMNCVRFAAYFTYKISASTPEPLYTDDFLSWLALSEASAAGAFLFFVTAMACWIQVFNRLYEVGAYHTEKAGSVKRLYSV
jgi:hypothetical protein